METFILIDRNKRRRRLSASGFTLVEITLALGIIAFAFVTIFGLIPTGLSTFRRAMDISIGGQIAQEMINDAQQTDFQLLLTKDGTTRYFDDQGTELPDVHNAIYHGILRVSKGPVIPGAQSNQQLLQVVAQVANNPGNKSIQTVTLPGAMLWDDPTISIVNCSAMVARQK